MSEAKSAVATSKIRAANGKKSYHHGDLRRSLLDAAKVMIREGGVEGISMRKLADQVGVSRTALYHHFADKHDLLCALAEEGFRRYSSETLTVVTNESLTITERLSRHVREYVIFAVENPEYYDLMFGRDIWKTGKPTPSLKTQAYDSFRSYARVVAKWQELGVIPADIEPLRFAQVSWSMLHGISRLLIDGIYVDREAMEEMCQMAAKVLLNNFK